MALWSVVLFAAIAAVAAEPESVATFPELARAVGSSRIVSGWEASPGQFPYQVSIRMVNLNGNVNACGATIIHPEWGMSAAHCTATRHTIVVRVGTLNLTQPNAIFETREYYNHPNYNANIPSVVQPNDISLIKFGRSLALNELVQPVRLQPSKDKDRSYQNIRLTATGWGNTWTQGTSPENMNWVFLRGVTNFFCFIAFGGSSIIQDSTICASGYNVSSQSTCQGDSGGALTEIGDDGIVTQVGISSFVSGQGCHADVPAGFIRPGHYHGWFKEVTGIDFDWGQEDSSSSSSESESESSEESKSSEESESSEETTSSPEEESEEKEVTASPEEESKEETTASPEEESEEEQVTASPEEESEEKEETASPEKESEEVTASPEEESKEEEATASPEEGSEEQEVTASPEEEGETEEEATTAAPEEEEEGEDGNGEDGNEEDNEEDEDAEEAEIANRFFNHYFGKLWTFN